MSKIEWCDETWNPITGCTPVSEGCANCYARRMAKRLAGRFGYPESPYEFDVTYHRDKLEQPLHWKKPRVIFVCSMGDWLHPGVADFWRTQMLDVVADCPQHRFLFLTKRPELYLPPVWFDGAILKRGVPLNACLGVTVETQDQVWRLERLAELAGTLFVSFEPLLGPIVIPPELLVLLDGVIVGGESGPKARPMHPDWARGIRDQCVEAGVPFTFKAWGEWALTTGIKEAMLAGPHISFTSDGTVPNSLNKKTIWMARVGKKTAGRELDGVVWDQWPWEVL